MKMATYLAGTALGASLLAVSPASAAGITACPQTHAAQGLCYELLEVKDDKHNKHRGKGHKIGRGKGHAKHHRASSHDDDDDDGGYRDRDRDRDWSRRERIERLRDNAYEQGYRDAVRDSWRIGERVPRDSYRVVPDYNQYGWPAPRSGSSYVYADDRYYLIEQATGLVLDILTR